MNEDPLFPYRTTPRRVALDVIDALAACPAVSRVALFGSLAGEGHDGWSDIDMLCEVHGPDGAWQAAAALRQAIPLRWHGVFHDLPAPSGRHWLLGESVFHSVDLAYLSPEAFAARLAESPATVHLDRPGVASAGQPEIPAVTEEYEFTHGLYALTKAMKGYLRDEGGWDAVPEAFGVLDRAFNALRGRPAGTDVDDVMAEARTLYYTLFMERSRYGGE